MRITLIFLLASTAMAIAEEPAQPSYWARMKEVGATTFNQAKEAMPDRQAVLRWVPDRSSLSGISINMPELPDGRMIAAGLNAWIPTGESMKGWMPSKDAVSGYMPTLPTISSLLQNGDLGIGNVVDLRQAITDGWALVPQDSKWWTDYAVSTVSVGVVVGWASFGCAVVATPGGPVLVALSVAACSVVGADVAERLVRAGYAKAGESLDESALTAGKLTGRILGSIVGFQGSEAFNRMLTFRHYKDYGGYAKHARDLTRASLRPYKAEVAGLRSQGYDIDHIISVKCGWRLGMLPMEIASMRNLHGLPSSINRSIGAKGC